MGSGARAQGVLAFQTFERVQSSNLVQPRFKTFVWIDSYGVGTVRLLESGSDQGGGVGLTGPRVTRRAKGGMVLDESPLEMTPLGSLLVP
jgi:hypothetical protein